MGESKGIKVRMQEMLKKNNPSGLLAVVASAIRLDLDRLAVVVPEVPADLVVGDPQSLREGK